MFSNTTYKKLKYDNDMTFFSFILLGILYGLSNMVFSMSVACLSQTRVLNGHGISSSITMLLGGWGGATVLVNGT